MHVYIGRSVFSFLACGHKTRRMIERSALDSHAFGWTAGVVGRVDCLPAYGRRSPGRGRRRPGRHFNSAAATRLQAYHFATL